MIKTDVIVLGGGPGGYLAAERAAQGGLAVTLVEDRNLGGVCLNEGCIPSKTLLNSAKIFEYARSSENYGVTTKEAMLDHKKVMKRKDAVVKALVGGVAAKLNAHDVNVVSGKGVLKEKTSAGTIVTVGSELYVAKQVIIATGSEPILPNIPGLLDGVESGFVITNREIFELTEIPEELCIIGGGVIGLEMASYFATAGSKVTVIEMMDTIAPAFDKEITNTLLKELKKKGIQFLLSSQVTEISKSNVTYKTGDKESTVKANLVLCSIGRKPTIDNIGLESLNIYTEKGAIVTDDKMQTNVSGIYAVGDVNGKYMLAHTAYREAEVAVAHILGKKDFMSYEAVPFVIYTYPEVACVGKTQEQAKAEGIEAKTVTMSFKYSGRYLAEVDKGNGFCKIIVDTKNDCIVGIHMIGPYVSEMIFGVTHMIEAKTPLNHIKGTIFPHPTVCEVIREALFEI